MSTITPKSRIVNNAVELYTDDTYLTKNPTWGVEDSGWKAEQIAKVLSLHALQPNDVGEVGCGAGEILKQLSKLYPKANYYGYEVSPHAFEFCKQREAHNIHFFLKDLAQEDKYFDVLLCLDVFEHVEDYFGFLRSIKNKAKYKIFHIPLDISVLSVLRSLMMKARSDLGHLHYYSKETALATLEDSGYMILDHAYTTGFVDLPAKEFKTRLSRWPRRLLYAISPDWCAKLLGGCSLIVLAK
jgi:hypothetical protein